MNRNVVNLWFYSTCSVSYGHPTPSIPTPSPIKTAGCSDAGATSQRDPSRTTGQFCVSYRLHGRQGTDTTPRRWPAHSIGASEGRRLRASPRSSPVNRLPHPPSPPTPLREQRQGGKRERHPDHAFTIKHASRILVSSFRFCSVTSLKIKD